MPCLDLGLQIRCAHLKSTDLINQMQKGEAGKRWDQIAILILDQSDQKRTASGTLSNRYPVLCEMSTKSID